MNLFINKYNRQFPQREAPGIWQYLSGFACSFPLRHEITTVQVIGALMIPSEPQSAQTWQTSAQNFLCESYSCHL